MPNVWSPQTGRWEDTDHPGNTYDPTLGFWTNAQGQRYDSNTNSWGTQNSSSGGYNPQSGYGYDLLERAQAQEKLMQDLKQKHEKEMADLDDAHKKYFTAMDSQLKERMQNNQITNEQYQQGRTMAQQESEFARNLAQRSLESKQQDEIARAAEMRQERSLQASLAANPNDWVAYEFYKRQLGNPGTMGSSSAAPASSSTPAAVGAAQAGGGASPAPVGGGASGSPGLSAASPTMLGGGGYSPAPPAYGDSATQTLAADLFNKNGTAYNPNLKGEGVFGTQIQAPNSMSRNAAGKLSDSELGMLSGLLKAGVNVNGQRVAIDDKDWFKQSQDSWVPTFDNAQSQYAQRQKLDYS